MTKKKSKQIHQPPQVKSNHGLGVLWQLEPRMMFDGAAVSASIDVVEQTLFDLTSTDTKILDAEVNHQKTPTIQLENELEKSLTSYEPPTDSANEIVFVDTHVKNYETILAGIDPNIQVVLLDSQKDGVKQMADYLTQHQSVEAIHIISHGSSGSLQLGTGSLTFDSMTQQYTAEMAVIKQALSEQADILIYGCDFAEGQAGQAAAKLLSQLTGSDIAASIDDTGYAGLGGDWDLELQTGSIETHLAISYDIQADWIGLMSLTASGSETRINTTTTDTQTHNSVGNTYNPDSVAMDANGNFVSVWESAGNIYGQRYISDGTAQGSEFVIANNAENERLASVSMNASGAFVVTWERDQGTGDFDIYARLYNASGTAVGSEFLVNETLTYDQQHARAAMAADGSFVVVFESTPEASGTSAYNVYAQRYDASGVKIGSNGLVNTTTAGYQGNADIAMDSAGNFVIVWDSERSVGSSTFSIYGQRYDSSGVAQGAEFLVNTTASDTDHYAAVAMNDSGNFIVTWSRHSGGDTDVHAQRFDSVGVAQGSAISVTNTTLYDQEISGVVMDQSGNFVVSWSSNLQDGSGWGVYTRQYDSTGTALTTESQVATTTANVQDYSGIAYQNGKVVVTWSGNGTGDSTGIFIQRYDAAGGNAAPMITSNGGGLTAAISVAENTTTVTTVTATDADAGATLTYSISGGADAAKFTINSSTGALSFVTAPNYESPTDSGGNNVYDVMVTVKDNNGGADSQSIDVTVTAVNDAPTSSGGLVSGVEDTPLILTWGQFNVSDVDSSINANSAVRIQSLPALGSLQVSVDGEWKAVVLNQIVTKATIDAGNLRYVPVADESGYPGYATPGIGNQRNDYAQFNFAPVQITPITIANPNAEADTISEGTRQQGAIGWTANTVSPYIAGVQNLASGQFSVDNDNTFFVEQDGTWLGQILYTAFDSANNYVLNLNVGWRLDQPASQYRIELWAGGTRLGFLDDTQVTEVQGSLVQAALHINGTGFATQNGQWLGMWMIGLNGQTNFDNLQLMSFNRSTDIGAAATMTVDITPANDAPVVADTALSMTVAEDAGAPSGAVGSLVSAFTGGISDVDSGAVKGIAITATDETNGSWYYTTNGGTTWTAVGTVSSASSLLLTDNGSTRLYFAPAANYDGTSSAALTVRAWDQTSGTVGTKVSTASTGGSTAFSSATDTIDVTVTAVNDAPVTTGGSVIGTEDTTSVFTWAEFNVTDSDSPITGATAIQIMTLSADGVLEVSNGISWEPVTKLQTITKATIDAGWLRFRPDVNESGYDAYSTPGVGDFRQDYAQFTYRPVQTILITNPDAELGNTYAEGTGNYVATGWVISGSVYTSNFTAAEYPGDHDQVFALRQGAQMSQVLSANFSSALDYVLTIDVGWNPSWLSPVFEVQLWAGGTQVGVVDQSSITPVQGEFVRATLVVDGSAFSAVDGQPLEIRLLETSGFANDSDFDNIMLTTMPGGIGPTATMTIDITPQNDAPVLTDTALSLTVAENVGAPSGAAGSLVSAFTGGGSDVDSGAVKGIAITGSDETNGTWYYTTNGGSTWTAVGTVSSASSLLLADNGSTRLYFSPNANYNGTSSAALTVRAWDQTSGTAGAKMSTASTGGTTAFSSAADTFDVTVTPDNDAPTDIVFVQEFTAEQVVNTYTSSDQYIPSITALPNGGWLTVWESNGQDGSGRGVYGQRFDVDGNKVGAEFRINQRTTDSQHDPVVSAFSDGRYVVTWVDQITGVRAWIMARVFNADGTAATAEFQVSPGTDGNTEGYYPTVQVLDSNRFVVVWSNEAGANNWSEAGRIYDSAGVLQGAQFSISSSGILNNISRIDRLADGGFAVTWGYNSSTQLRLFNSDGSARTAAIALPGNDVADVAVLRDGNVVVAYAAGGDINAAIYNASGVLQVGAFNVNAGATSGIQSQPRITVSDDGFVVAWTSDTGDGSSFGVFAQRFIANGNSVGGVVQVNTTTIGAQTEVDLVQTSIGQVRVVWSSQNLDGSGYGIASRVLGTPGATVAENAANGTWVADALGFRDVDSTSGTYSLVNSAGGRFAIDSNTGVITVADGSLLDYESATSHSVTVRVTDSGGLTYDETVTINVTNVNEAPTGVDATVTINEDSSHVLTATNFGFSDVDAGDSFSAVRIDSLPGAGTLQLSGVNVTAGQVITVADITSGNLVFTPAANANGTGYTSIAFSVRDSNNAYDIVPNTFTFNVATVNDAPTSSGGSMSGVEDTPLVLTWGQFNVSDIDSPITANSAVRIQSLPTLGSLQVLVDGEWKAVVLDQIVTKATIDAGNLRYVPAADESGYPGYATPGIGNQRNDYAQFTFTPIQGTPITITNPNAEANTIPEGTWQQSASGWTVGTVSPYIAGAQNLASGQFSVDHDNTFFVEQGGTWLGQILYTAFDSANDYVLSLDVGWRLDQPASQYRVELWAGGTRLGFLDETQVTEVQGSMVQATLHINGAGFATQNGQWLGLWMVGVDGQTNFDNLELMSYNRSADIGTAATMTVDITPVNDDAPTDLALSGNSVAENAANGTLVGTVSATDPDSGDTQSYSLIDTAGGRFAINNSTGEITVADGSLLNYEAAASHSVTVRVTDSGGLAYNETFMINVTNVNEAPTGADAIVTINEDTSYTMTSASFGFSDVDAGDSLSAVRIDTLPSVGSLTLSGVLVMPDQIIAVADITAGNLVFTPVTNGNGTGYTSFTFSVRDSGNTYDATPNTLIFNVTAVDDAPINTVPGAQTVAVDTSLAISGLSVSDIDGNLTTVQLSVTNGTVAVTLSGGATIASGANATSTVTLTGTQADINATLDSLRYQGNSLFTGTDTLTLLSTDGNGATDTDTVIITVSNSAPTNVLPASQTVVEDMPLTISGLSVTDTDGNLASVQLSVVNGTLSLTLSGATTISSGSNGSGSLTLSGTQADLNATLASLTYQGTLNFSGLDTLTMTATDSTGTVDTDNLSITVTAVNDAPTDINLSANTVEENTTNGTVVGTVMGIDPDSGDMKSYSFTDSAGGRFAINSSTGQITVADGTLLDFESATNHSVTVRVTDSGGLTYDETFTINVTNVNEAPTGADAIVTINEDTSYMMTPSNFGFSDVDAGDSLSAVRINSLPGAGTLQLSGVNVIAGQVITVVDITAGNLAFTPAVNANGAGYASFSFFVRDSNNAYDTASNTLTVNVTAVNDAPVVSGAGGTLTYTEGDGAHVLDGTLALTDVDSATLTGATIAISSGFVGSEDVLAFTNAGNITGSYNSGTGVLTLTGIDTLANYEAALESVTYLNTNINNPNTGDRTISWQVTDGNTNSTAATSTVTVTAVNDAPIISTGNLVADGSFESGGSAWRSNSVLEISNFPGSYGITAPSDGGYFAEVEGRAQSGAPSWIEQTISTVAGTTYQFTVAAVTRNDVNIGDMGVLSVDGTQVLTFTTGSDWSDFTTTFVATSSSTTIRITSAGSSSGTAAGPGDAGGLIVDNVRVVEDSPVTFNKNGPAVVLTSTGSIFDAELSSANNFSGAILTLVRNGGANVEDVFSTTGNLSLSGGDVIVSGTTIGTYTNGVGSLGFTFNSNATNVLVNSAMQQITYSNSSNTPPASVQINWTFSDGNGGAQGSGGAIQTTGSTTINITANNAPTDLALSGNSVAENAINGTSVGTISATDLDSGDTQSYSLTDTAGGRFAINSSTGEITVADGALLNYEAAASHSVTTRVTDSGGLTYDETFIINLTNINEAPTGTDATVTINEDTSHTTTAANFGFSDIDAGDSLSAVRINTLPGTGSLTLSGVAVTTGKVVSVADIRAGNLVFTPLANANGMGYASFTFSVRDSNSTYDIAPNTFTVNVTAVNDAPTDLALSGNRVVENAANGTSVGTVNATDPDSGDTRSYSLTDSAGGRFAINNSTGEITVADGTLLNYEAVTSHSVTVRVTDSGGLTYDETFIINLTDSNEAPINTVPGSQIINRNAPLTLGGIFVSDANNDLSTVQLVVGHGTLKVTLSGTASISAGSNGTNSLTLSGSLTDINVTLESLIYQSNYNYIGIDTLNVISSDSNSAQDVDTVVINVVYNNNLPVGLNDSYTLLQNSIFSVEAPGLLINDSDADNDKLSIIPMSDPEHGTLVMSSDGSFIYTPNKDFVGVDSFTYVVHDGYGNSSPVTVTLTVNPVVLPLPETPSLPVVPITPSSPAPVLSPPVAQGAVPSIVPATVLPAIQNVLGPVASTISENATENARLTLQPTKILQGGANSNLSEHLQEISSTASHALLTQNTVIANHQLWEEVENIQIDIQKAFDEKELTANAASVLGISLTAGIVGWLTRSGSMLASLLSIVPAWKSVDPLSIVVAKSGKNTHERLREGNDIKQKENSAEELF